MSEIINQAIFAEAKWIWAEGKEKKNDMVIFRKVFNVERKPKHCTVRIAADTHYHLNVNGKFVIWQGGINHPAGGFGGYYDEVDIAKFLKKGDNALVVVCRYNGNSGNDDISNGKAGLIIEAVADEEKILFSTDENFDAYRNEANVDVGETPDVNFAGFSHCYDATRERQLSDLYLPSFGSNIFSKASVICGYGEAPFGLLKKRAIPHFNFSQKTVFGKIEKNEKDNLTFIYRIKLPRAMIAYPSLIATALGTEKIKISTDRTISSGGFGDHKKYTAPHIEYICKAQKQTYDGLVGIYGQELIFEAPKTVKIKKLGYRYVEYDSEVRGNFFCSDGPISTLATKCINTLKACMTDRIINNPDRDRATTLDGANVAVRSIMSLYDADALSLVRKTISDVFDNIMDGYILSNVPSGEPIEIPSAGLLTISEMGMFASYSNYFSDMDENFLLSVVSYLGKWDIGADGLIEPRGGWIDNLFNIDAAVIENCLYYSALKFAKRLAETTGKNDFDQMINERLDGFAEKFEKRFFNGLGFSSNPDYNDDRANAFAVVTGLCNPEKYDLLSDIIVSTQNASPYLEGYVIEALCIMGKSKYARRRMASRYAGMTESESSTLGEEFCLDGALTSVRSVMPISVLLEYFGGVKITNGGNEITVTPDLGDLDSLDFCCVTAKGQIRGEYCHTKNDSYEYVIHNDSKCEATINLKAIGGRAAKTYKVGKGKYKYTLE